MVKTYSYKADGNKKLSPHFSVREFASINGGKLYSDSVKVDADLIDILERLYSYLGCSKIVITSGYRTAAHDKAVGGSGKGYHTTGQAADINCWHKVGGKEERYHGSDICCALQSLGWHHGIGWIAGAAVHVDTRKSRYWFDETNGNRSIGNDWYTFFAAKGYVVTPPVSGDVDGDGKVTTTDARIVLQAAAGKETLDERQKVSADVDGDGEVTTTDAREILKKAAK